MPHQTFFGCTLLSIDNYFNLNRVACFGLFSTIYFPSALERVSVVRPKAYDPSDPPTHGLLDEMSLAELQERLILIKSKEQREVILRKFPYTTIYNHLSYITIQVEARRQRTIAFKEIKHKELMKKAAEIARVREIARTEGAKLHERIKIQQVEEDKIRAKFSEECVVRAHERISKKKEQMLVEII